ncbi:uncharacterized protein [Eucyclogobius newberryi]|uniref:uncharacterized protein n=1 Tax=Eucyclogobius newberryi TaxID=166745 RepID=UPI003B595A52
MSQKPDEGKPYIKKPPNAFMLFRAEQRQNVADELQITNSSKVNVVLGKRWKMMSKQQQAPYYEQALKEKQAHKAKYPEWSAKENFGKKVKRRKVPYQHPFAFPMATINQQPVMTWPYATAPMSFPNQALNNQGNPWPFQKLPEETIMINGIPVHPTPLEAFLNQAHENQAPIKILPIEGFTTPGFDFQDLSNQAPPCNTYEVFLNMAPEDKASIKRILDQPD